MEMHIKRLLIYIIFSSNMHMGSYCYKARDMIQGSQYKGQRIFWELTCILKLSPFVSWGKSSDFSIIKLSRIQTLLNRCTEVDSVLYTMSWTEIYYGNLKNGYFSDDLSAPSGFASPHHGYPPYLFSSFLLCNSFHLSCHFPGEGLLLSIPLPFNVLNNTEGLGRYMLELVVYKVVSSHLAPFATLGRLCCTYNIFVIGLERVQW